MFTKKDLNDTKAKLMGLQMAMLGRLLAAPMSQLCRDGVVPVLSERTTEHSQRTGLVSIRIKTLIDAMDGFGDETIIPSDLISDFIEVQTEIGCLADVESFFKGVK